LWECLKVYVDIYVEEGDKVAAGLEKSMTGYYLNEKMRND
jgi:hypothetical protein